MKKFVVLISSFFIFVLFLTGNVFAEPKDIQKSDFAVKIGDQTIQLSMPAYIIDNIAYVSARDIGDIFEMNVVWDSNTKTIKFRGFKKYISGAKKNQDDFLKNPDVNIADFNVDMGNGYFSSRSPFYTINNRAYIPLVDFAKREDYIAWWNYSSKRYELTYILPRRTGRSMVGKNYILKLGFGTGITFEGNHKHEDGNKIVRINVDAINTSAENMVIKIPDDFKVLDSKGVIRAIQPDDAESQIVVPFGENKSFPIYFEVPETDHETILIFKPGDDGNRILFDIYPDSLA
ncbi:MAG TPA: stalk domain-containing protein [Clostridia bacterium]